MCSSPTPRPGTASYNDLVEGNYIAGNGLSGVTLHAHLIQPGQFEDLNGNVVIGNTIAKNNLDGDTLDSPASPTDPQDDRRARLLRRHARQRHDRPEPRIQQRDRDLAQQGSHRIRTPDQQVHQRENANLSEQLS